MGKKGSNRAVRRSIMKSAQVPGCWGELGMAPFRSKNNETTARTKTFPFHFPHFPKQAATMNSITNPTSSSAAAAASERIPCPSAATFSDAPPPSSATSVTVTGQPTNFNGISKQLSLSITTSNVARTKGYDVLVTQGVSDHHAVLFLGGDDKDETIRGLYVDDPQLFLSTKQNSNSKMVWVRFNVSMSKLKVDARIVRFHYTSEPPSVRDVATLPRPTRTATQAVSSGGERLTSSGFATNTSTNSRNRSSAETSLAIAASASPSLREINSTSSNAASTALQSTGGAPVERKRSKGKENEDNSSGGKGKVSALPKYEKLISSVVQYSPFLLSPNFALRSKEVVAVARLPTVSSSPRNGAA